MSSSSFRFSKIDFDFFFEEPLLSLICSSKRTKEFDVGFLVVVVVRSMIVGVS